MLSKNLVLRKRCYYYGDTKIKTDSKIYLSKTKMELMKKIFLKYWIMLKVYLKRILLQLI